MSDTPTPPAAAGEPAKKPARRRLPAADGTAPKKRRVLKA